MALSNVKYDFAGWATRNELRCADGRVIHKNAFAPQDGEQVPLMWQHGHADPENVLGHAILENRDEGVYAYCSFNDTERGQAMKKAVQHGDIRSLSIYANHLQEKAGEVFHGIINELSLCVKGANPGAYIETVMAHGDGESGLILNYDETTFLIHTDSDKSDADGEEGKTAKDGEEKKDKDAEKTVGDVLETMNKEQRDVVDFLVGAAASGELGPDDEGEEIKHSDSEGGNKMALKKNVFEGDTDANVLSHSAGAEIIQIAKSSQVGSLQAAIGLYAEENGLQHNDVTKAVSGFTQTGEGNITTLFPEYHDVKPGAPDLITDDQSWVAKVINKVHKSPFSRIRTSQVDIRDIESLRAKAYNNKGAEKKLAGQYTVAKRTTEPTTIYVKSALNRDDTIDITDFSIVDYQRQIDDAQLKAELARAILIGDGRDEADDSKIDESKIRPIWKDDELFTLHRDLDIESMKKELQGTETGAHFGPNYIEAEAMVQTILYAREKYKGSGQPDLYITPHEVNVMLLAKDMNGRRIYSTITELAAALNVNSIITVEQFAGQTRETKDSKKKELVCLLVNLADYSLGATKGGEVTHFTDFDIDFNQLKSLMETRCSGALTKIFSAIAIEKDVTTSGRVSG